MIIFLQMNMLLPREKFSPYIKRINTLLSYFRQMLKPLKKYQNKSPNLTTENVKARRPRKLTHFRISYNSIIITLNMYLFISNY